MDEWPLMATKWTQLFLFEMFAAGWLLPQLTAPPIFFHRPEFRRADFDANAGVLGLRETFAATTTLRFPCRAGAIPDPRDVSRMISAYHDYSSCEVTAMYMDEETVNITVVFRRFTPHGCGPAGAHAAE